MKICCNHLSIGARGTEHIRWMSAAALVRESHAAVVAMIYARRWQMTKRLK